MSRKDHQMASSSSSTSSPCAGCKFLRRKCTAECVFAPYFPPDQPHKFANVHKIFGASNITKLLNDLPPPQREDAANSLAFEAEARMKDPVYGCVAAISFLQRQMLCLQRELAAAHADLARYTGPTGVLSNPGLPQFPPVGAGPAGIGMGTGVGIGTGICSPSLNSMQMASRSDEALEAQMNRDMSYDANLGHALGVGMNMGASQQTGFLAPSRSTVTRHSSLP